MCIRDRHNLEPDCQVATGLAGLRWHPAPQVRACSRFWGVRDEDMGRAARQAVQEPSSRRARRTARHLVYPDAGKERVREPSRDAEMEGQAQGALFKARAARGRDGTQGIPVSYTHLTLP